jgi:hypothetical protein
MAGGWLAMDAFAFLVFFIGLVAVTVLGLAHVAMRDMHDEFERNIRERQKAIKRIIACSKRNKP